MTIDLKRHGINIAATKTHISKNKTNPHTKAVESIFVHSDKNHRAAGNKSNNRKPLWGVTAP